MDPNPWGNITYTDNSITFTFDVPDLIRYPAVTSTDDHADDSACDLPCNHNHDDTLCDVCTQIAQVESQIESPRSQLEELHKKLRSLRTKRNDLSIIGKLPFHIVSDIFTLCLPPIERDFLADYEPPCSVFATPRLPFKLSAVCASWRRIVYSISQMWSTLSIDIYNANLQHISHRLQWAALAPLRVQLHGSAQPQDPSLYQSHILDVIMLVKQNLHRMAFLCLNIPCQFIHAFFSQDIDIPNNLPILKELHFHCSVSGRRGFCIQPHNFVLSTDPPCPHKFYVTGSSISNVRLNWDNVRHLTLEGRRDHEDMPTVLSVLSEGKRLYVIDLIFYPDPRSPPAERPVIQNSIRNLRLFHTSTKFLSLISMPYLETLVLWQSSWDPTNPLRSFLQRSACPLKTMVWKPVGTDLMALEHAFIDVLQCTPKLQRLRIDVTSAFDEDSELYVVTFLEHVARAVSPAFLPVLQGFIYVGPTIRVSPSLLLDIAESRSGPLPPSEGGQVTQPLELLLNRYSHDEELEPLTEADEQRILRLNAAGQKFTIVENDEGCDMVCTDFSDYYRDN